ncbi:hypothetical protein KAE78_15085 (plasmid) [Microbacterium sp. NIBRBAC000506063]|nr:hypothetical protein KAE78_15085 [Microbacterium sp. NIBRBAC000506063]
MGVAANMLAAPAAPIATVIGLLACLALPIPLLADLFAASAWLPAAWIAMTAHISAALPGARVLITPGIGSALIVTVLTVAVTVLLVRGRGEGARTSCCVALRSCSSPSRSVSAGKTPAGRAARGDVHPAGLGDRCLRRRSGRRGAPAFGRSRGADRYRARPCSAARLSERPRRRSH